jgi:integrase
MVNYKTCGTYGELKIKLDDRIILPDREYLFNFKTRSAYTIWANSVVKKYFPTMTLHKFRHSFLRSKMFLLPNPIIARMMGHSMEQQLIYAYGYQFSKWYTDVMEWKCPW